MSESQINPTWIDSPYEVSFVFNGRLVSSSCFPNGMGSTVSYVSLIPPESIPVVEDTEELLHPI